MELKMLQISASIQVSLLTENQDRHSGFPKPGLTPAHPTDPRQEASAGEEDATQQKTQIQQQNQTAQRSIAYQHSHRYNTVSLYFFNPPAQYFFSSRRFVIGGVNLLLNTSMCLGMEMWRNFSETTRSVTFNQNFQNNQLFDPLTMKLENNLNIFYCCSLSKT